MIEEGNLAEELARPQRDQRRLLAANHQAHAQFALQHQIHGVAVLALLHDLRPLAHGLDFHEADEPLQLLIVEIAEDLHPPQHAGLERYAA